ncbi:MAG: hypothetical protein A2600_02785 [Candidatus Lambdaproteobacteria bacterium RIFOXYD1_FULL_56_27]|uniref:UDP-3-O-acylglucosamine N-acyltransferase n=1 Tax=Candidatus Lambdaproteobacteria bacterium RIFOXYD2_FULL_56_26 TaxID=1817773 RepID=A0A1F6H2T4_9PROT|nr:MAG: hypothetical protein A2557_06850 [Candidatus Lambdaproteobacteria bacterium RIFOXYD2_FULL_56_26]OGH05323.1 MAG: hypothetical protein A2426_05175 [Candidatus Lambdaproteobacteria bacterium RIFOXYC1_FULL_56_13]OGH09165.1 MAG: hypothetical protein A2600_02785 [Candidatus Lambdaproteobacteria bacterium RIFOXYD1_FULL_56_27]
MITLEALCHKLGTPYKGDPSLTLTHACGFESIGPGGLAFVSNPKALAALPTPGGVFRDQGKNLHQVDPGLPCAIIVPPGTEAEGRHLIFSPDPLDTHVRATLILHPGPASSGKIHPLAFVDPTAEIGKNVTLDPGVVIYPRVKIGQGSVLRANVVVMEDSVLGEDCLLYPNVTVREGCLLGNQVILHSGVVIGADGYGYYQRDGHNHKIPQVGRVVLEDQVEVGANSCIDRARFDQTRLGRNTKLDNLVHIAHNVEVGEESLITAQSGIAGSTKTGSHLMMGGQSGIRDNLKIGSQVTLLARTLVTSKTGDQETLAGMPGRPYHKWRHNEALLGQLDSFLNRLKNMEAFLAGLGFFKKPPT